MLTELENAVQKVAGVKQVRRALAAGHAHRVFLARDADPQLVGPLERQAEEQGVEVRWVGSMRELGQACRIAVGCAVAATIQ